MLIATAAEVTPNKTVLKLVRLGFTYAIRTFDILEIHFEFLCCSAKLQILYHIRPLEFAAVC